MRVCTHLMFEGNAAAAMELYCRVLPESQVIGVERYGEGEAGKAGTVKMARLRLAGTEFIVIDSPVKHAFTFTPSTSLFVEADTREQFDRIVEDLAKDGRMLMPPANYGFSTWFAWFQDRFGVSWQLNLA